MKIVKNNCLSLLKIRLNIVNDYLFFVFYYYSSLTSLKFYNIVALFRGGGLGRITNITTITTMTVIHQSHQRVINHFQKGGKAQFSQIMLFPFRTSLSTAINFLHLAHNIII